MRIVHVIAGLYGGGRERRMTQLVKSLDEKAVEQYILALSQKVDYDIPLGVNLIVLDTSSRLRLCVSFLRRLRDIEPDIVHLWTEIPVILVLTVVGKMCFGYKYIVGFLADGNPVKGNLMKLAVKAAYCSADKVISNSWAGIYAKQAPVKKSCVVYNGFDFRRIADISVMDGFRLREELSVGSSYLVTMVARFSPAKDYETFIDVAILMGARRRDVIFLAVGDGNTLEYWKSYCHQRGVQNILFLGRRHDVEKILSVSRVSLLFTNAKVHAEGFSNSIMESMALGVPVIASSGGGTEEVIADGEDGFIVGAGEAMRAVEIISSLLDDEILHDQIGLKARRKIVEKFSLEKMCASYLDIYNSLCVSLFKRGKR